MSFVPTARFPRFFFAILALLCATVCADGWPQWRGPMRDGHVPVGVAVPTDLTAHKVLWHIPLGEGVASPVVSGGRVFYIDNQQGQETVHGADAMSGKVLWSEPLDAVTHDSQSPPGPRCTPLADEDRVYAQSCRGELRCVNATDGRLIWRTSYVRDLGAIFIGEKGPATGARRHGYTGSPLIDRDHLITEAGGVHGAALVCFDKRTGAIIWKSQDDIPGYAAPVLANLGGIRQVVAFMADGVIALDVATGNLLWRVPVKTALGRNVTAPVVVGDRVVVSSYQAGIIGIKVTKQGQLFDAHNDWTNKDAAINFSNPVAVGEFLYGVGPAKNLICVNIRTGRQVWSQDGYFPRSSGGTAHAGMIVMGNNILILTDNGESVLIAADPTHFRQIGRTRVCGNTWCNPAYADGNLYLRDSHDLWCIRLLP